MPAGDAPFHPQHRLVRAGRQSLETWVLFGEMLSDDTPRGGMEAARHRGSGSSSASSRLIAVHRVLEGWKGVASAASRQGIAVCRRRRTAIRRVSRRPGEVVAQRSLAFYDAVARRLAGVGAGP
jgi:hypothetical protein